MPRPTKLTPEVQRTIVNARIEGASLNDAAAAAGISIAALHEWAARGRAIASGQPQAENPTDQPCPACQAEPGEPCHALRQPGRQIHPHKTRRRLAGDPSRDRLFVEFADALDDAEAQGVILDLRSVGLAARPREVSKTTTKTAPVRVRGEVLLDANDQPVMVTEETKTEWVEIDWRAAAWRLARRRPEEFGERVTTRIEGELEVSGPGERREEESIERDVAILNALLEGGALDDLGMGADAGGDAGAAAGADAAAADASDPVPAEPEAGGVPADRPA